MAFDGALFEARALNAWRGDRHVLRDVSFVVRSGEFLQVSGPNGVGKTTLLRVACGLLPAETGDLLWRERPVRGQRDEFNAELGYLGHLNSLKGDLTARENLRFLAGMRTAQTPKAIDGALERVGILSHGDIPARALSAGQKRRLSLARLLLDDAALWMLDEPATNLDTAGVRLVEDLISGHVHRGGIVIAAAHRHLLEPASFMHRLELAA